MKKYNHTVKNLQQQEGFTLIELLIVLAIIGILAAIVIPAYIGMKERGRKGAVTRTVEAHVSELRAWMNSSKKAGTIMGGLTDGDGLLLEGTDKTNEELGSSDIIQLFIDRHDLTDGRLPLSSPWDGLKPLFIYEKHKHDMAACEATAVTYSGQIVICYNGTNAGAGIRNIFVVAVDKQGKRFYRKSVSVD